MRHWLLKTEPSSYSIDDLARDKRTLWTGVRNYQARNFLQEMKKGDLALLYHSSADIVGVYGVAKISKEGVADPTAFDEKDGHYDPKATDEKPIWCAPEIAFVKMFVAPVTLNRIKSDPKLEGIAVAERGSRLSVMPVSEDHFARVLELAGSAS